MKRFLSAIFNGDGNLKVEVSLGTAYPVSPTDTISRHALRINCHPYWDGVGHPFKHVYCLREIRDAKGRAVAFRSQQAYGSPKPQIADFISGAARRDFSLYHWLPPGTYELEFVFDVGAVPAEAIPRGFEGYWGTAAKWPAPGKLWEYRHRCTIVIPDT